MGSSSVRQAHCKLGSLRAKSSACVAVASSVTQKFIGVIGSRSLPLEWAAQFAVH